MKWQWIFMANSVAHNHYQHSVLVMRHASAQIPTYEGLQDPHWHLEVTLTAWGSRHILPGI